MLIFEKKTSLMIGVVENESISTRCCIWFVFDVAMKMCEPILADV